MKHIFGKAMVSIYEDLLKLADIHCEEKCDFKKACDRNSCLTRKGYLLAAEDIKKLRGEYNVSYY